jgi:hypothetical protein
MRVAASWSTAKMQAATTTHQKRLARRRLTIRSEPIPEARRPVKEPRERMETWRSWAWAMKGLVAEGEKWVQRAWTLWPMLLWCC